MSPALTGSSRILCFQQYTMVRVRISSHASRQLMSSHSYLCGCKKICMERPVHKAYNGLFQQMSIHSPTEEHFAWGVIRVYACPVGFA